MRVAIAGCEGQLGRDIVEALEGHDLDLWTHERVEITDEGAVGEAFRAFRPDAVINTAAFHNVPLCEEEPCRAYTVNALGPRNLARVCEQAGARLIHISTDYVFDGSKNAPYLESDLPAPQSVYATTKLAGEHLIAAETGRFAVLRTSGLYGVHPCRAKGRNFVELMVKLARERGKVRVVTDEILTPTFTADLARQVVVVLEKGSPGLYHGTAEGSCSWFEFARAIFDIGGIEVDLQPTTSEEFPSPAKRPAYSVLENANLEDQGLNIMRDWREALEDYMGRVGLLR
jgi:dTDP-4-dehydrorhamnose reductase